MATTVILEAIARVNADPAQKSINTLEQELEFLKERFKDLAVGDAEFAKIGNRIREVQSELKTLDERFEGLGAEQKATAIAESFNVVVGAVGAVTGALVALGIESDAIENVEKRLLGIITVVTSLREVSNGLVAFQKVWPLLIANITKATIALRAFALANPFTAILAGITAVTAAIIALVKAQDDEVDVAKKINAEYKQQQQNLKDLKAVRDQIAAAQGETDVERLTRLKQENLQELTNARDRVKFYEQQKFQGEDVNNQLTIIREAKLKDQVLTAQLSAAITTANQKELDEKKKLAEERQKEADDKKKKTADELKQLEELRLARIEATKSLAAIEKETQLDFLSFLKDISKERLDLFDVLPITEQTLKELQFFLTEYYDLDRQIRLKELDKTVGAQLEANKNFFDKSVQGLEAGSAAYIAAEEQFQDNVLFITDFYAAQKLKIEKETTTEIEVINARARGKLTQLAFEQGEKLLEIEGLTYGQLKSEVIAYYDTVIAAAKAAGIATVELENQKSKALKSIDDERRRDIEEGIRNTLSGLSSFLSQQREIIDSQLQLDLIALGSNEVAKNALREKAFERQKKLRIAEATISGITGAVDAFNSVQNLNKIFPGLGITVGLGLAAAVSAITAQQIGIISNSSLNGGNISGTGFNNIGNNGSFSLPGGGGISTTPSLGGVLPGLGGGRVATAPTIGTVEQEPIRAYVLAGDVTNGVQANVAINSRRRLSGG